MAYTREPVKFNKLCCKRGLGKGGKVNIPIQF